MAVSMSCVICVVKGNVGVAIENSRFCLLPLSFLSSLALRRERARAREGFLREHDAVEKARSRSRTPPEARRDWKREEHRRKRKSVFFSFFDS